ncbi:MAG TPA: hypothetical protein VHD35_15785 [Chitinophagaceae bacterium]|nr:hypothetical protein [Chitinophagaceae bacterium]
MTQRDNILQELFGLESSLASIAPQNVYQVPDGYFEELANQVWGRIKAMEAKNAAEEINYLSPLLNSIPNQVPYSVPSGYFDELEEKILASVRNNEEYQTPKEELKAIAPLLSGLNKQMPYSIPDGYFEKVSSNIPSRLTTVTETKVISLTHRKWFRYAAAAVVISFIALGGLLFERRPSSVDPDKNPDEWIAKNVKKVSADKLDDFIRLADEESSSKENTIDKEEKSNEIKDLMKDVPENQIQDFINETSALGDDNSIMN